MVYYICGIGDLSIIKILTDLRTQKKELPQMRQLLNIYLFFCPLGTRNPELVAEECL